MAKKHFLQRTLKRKLHEQNFIRQKSKLKQKNQSPQDDIWFHPSLDHVHYHVVLETQYTSPRFRHPLGLYTPPGPRNNKHHTWSNQQKLSQEINITQNQNNKQSVKANLDLSERDQKTLLNFGVKTKETCRVSEVPACCGEGVHGCLVNFTNEGYPAENVTGNFEVKQTETKKTRKIGPSWSNGIDIKELVKARDFTGWAN